MAWASFVDMDREPWNSLTTKYCITSSFNCNLGLGRDPSHPNTLRPNDHTKRFPWNLKTHVKDLGNHEHIKQIQRSIKIQTKTASFTLHYCVFSFSHPIKALKHTKLLEVEVAIAIRTELGIII
jgi:hypothetical protein